MGKLEPRTKVQIYTLNEISKSAPLLACLIFAVISESASKSPFGWAGPSVWLKCGAKRIRRFRGPVWADAPSISHPPPLRPLGEASHIRSIGCLPIGTDERTPATKCLLKCDRDNYLSIISTKTAAPAPPGWPHQVEWQEADQWRSWCPPNYETLKYSEMQINNITIYFAVNWI